MQCGNYQLPVIFVFRNFCSESREKWENNVFKPLFHFLFLLKTSNENYVFYINVLIFFKKIWEKKDFTFSADN